jgi:hypothetical protein
MSTEHPSSGGSFIILKNDFVIRSAIRGAPLAVGARSKREVDGTIKTIK